MRVFKAKTHTRIMRVWPSLLGSDTRTSESYRRRRAYCSDPVGGALESPDAFDVHHLLPMYPCITQGAFRYPLFLIGHSQMEDRSWMAHSSGIGMIQNTKETQEISTSTNRKL